MGHPRAVSATVDQVGQDFAGDDALIAPIISPRGSQILVHYPAESPTASSKFPQPSDSGLLVAAADAEADV